MELIVCFNHGRDAAKAGALRVAPDALDTTAYGRVTMSKDAKREWLIGYDHELSGSAKFRRPRASDPRYLAAA